MKPLSIDEAKEFRAYLERVRDCARLGIRTKNVAANVARELWHIQKATEELHRWVNDFLTSEQEA